jgi:hypothetical protein
MMEAVRTSETSVDNHFTRQYIPEDNSEHNVLIILQKFNWHWIKYMGIKQMGYGTTCNTEALGAKYSTYGIFFYQVLTHMDYWN